MPAVLEAFRRLPGEEIEVAPRSELSKKLCYESFIAEASLEPVSMRVETLNVCQPLCHHHACLCRCQLQYEAVSIRKSEDGQHCSLDKLRLWWILSAV